MLRETPFSQGLCTASVLSGSRSRHGVLRAVHRARALELPRGLLLYFSSADTEAVKIGRCLLGRKSVNGVLVTSGGCREVGKVFLAQVVSWWTIAKGRVVKLE